MRELTAKQKMFVEEYLIDFNATQAAARAGYKNPEIGRQLIAKNNVKKKLQERIKEREKRTEITQDFVLKELFEIAKAKGSDYAKVIEKPIFDEKGKPIIDQSTGKQAMYKTVDLELTENLTENQKKAIQSIKRGKNGIEVSTCDKVKALELLGRHLGMWNDKVKVDGDVNLNNPYKELSTDDLIKIAKMQS